MRIKKKYYSFLFPLVLLVLIILQVYYIYNSYRLIEKDLIASSKEITTKIMDEMDEENDISKEQLLQYFKYNLHKQLIKSQFNQENKTNFSFTSLKPKIDSLINSYTKENNFEIAIRSEIYSLYDEINKKELILNNSLIVYESKNKITNPINVNQSVWTTDNSVEEKNTNLNVNNKQHYKYKVESRVDFELLNIKILLFKKIIPLIIVSLLIVSIIVYLYWKSIQNLEKQENKIKQLHLTIDSITHELNTPITTIKFAIQTIQETEKKKIINRQLSRLENTIESIFEKNIEEEQLVNEKIIDDLFKEIKQQHPEVLIILNLDFQQNNSLNSYDFRLIVQNLIENSIKYGATKIQLNFEFNNIIKLLFSDNGIGIPEKDIPFVFDKYYRVNREININVNGLGIGLYIVKTTTNKYNGIIRLDNNKENGVNFLIELPNEK